MLKRGLGARLCPLLLFATACLCANTHSRSPLQQTPVTSGDPPALSLKQLPRCAGIRGSACLAYYMQTLDVGSRRQQRVFDKPCPVHPVHGTPCGLGVCHGDTGLCDCPAGVGSPDCSIEDPRPCTNGYRANRNSSTPASHIGPNKRDINWRDVGWTPSRCAGVCDDTTATCFCDGANFGRVPALPGSPPGSPPIRPGRLLHGNCQRLRTDDRGQPLQWGPAGGVKYEEIYGPQGWCTVDTPLMRCSCDLDGYDGPLCGDVTDTVCPNQCSGHGMCQRGFCKCFKGWFGLDCARLSDPTILLNPSTAANIHPAGTIVAAVSMTGAAAAGASAAAAGTEAGASSNAAAAAEAGQAAAEVSESDSSDLSGSTGSTDDSIASAEQERRSQEQDATTQADTAAAAAAAGDDCTAPFVQPEHTRFMVRHPHLAQVFVDPWFHSATEHPSHGAHTSTAAAGAAQTGPAGPGVAQGVAEGDVGGHPAIPQLYFTPVDVTAQQTSSSASSSSRHLATAESVVTQATRKPEHLPGKAVVGPAPLPAGAAAVADVPAAAESAAAAAAAAAAGSAAADTAANGVLLGKVRRYRLMMQHRRQTRRLKQQQQPPEVQSSAGASGAMSANQTPPPRPSTSHQRSQINSLQGQQNPLLQGYQSSLLQSHHSSSQSHQRSLLRHFWTGGGSQRPEARLAPSQATVTAAVQAWLAAAWPNNVTEDPGGSSSSSSSSSSSDNAGSSGSSGDGNISANGNGSSPARHSHGLVEALRAAGVQVNRLGSERDSALLMQMVNRGVSEVAAGGLRRPRIFVYDMPSRFVSRLLQYRSSKATCTWRVFTKSNLSMFTTAEDDVKSSWAYPLESHLHELMLQSPHRTLDPEEADFFYVPVYAACMMEAVAGWADAPWWHSYSKSHVKQGVLMYQDALKWIRTTYPYWNASRGANHIWLFAHDEGACWAPSEVYNTSLILTQWGRLGPPSLIEGLGGRHGPVMDSWTSKWAQNWNKWHDSQLDPLGLPGDQDYQELITNHPCYTPGKDLVLPAFRPPTLYRSSPFMGSDSKRSRDILVLLRGDMGTGRRAPERQQLSQLAADGDWRRRYSAWIGTSQELPGEQSALLSRSRYCLVVPIDGWSGTFEDAVLHGCIPVVVKLPDGIAPPFSTLLRLSSGVLTIPRSDLPLLPEILMAIRPAEEDALRSSLRTWWHRIAWLTHPFVRSQATAIVRDNLLQHAWVQQDVEQQQLGQQQALTNMGRPIGEEPLPQEAEDDGLLIPIRPSPTPEDSSEEVSGGDSSPESINAQELLQDSDGSSSSGTKSSEPGTQASMYNSSMYSEGAAASNSSAEQPQESDTEAVARLFDTNVWQPGAPLDDAFTTLMQWLHHKLQHPYDPSMAAGSTHQPPQHTRPPAATQQEQMAVD